MADWTDELPALAALSDQAAADALNAMTVPAPTVPVFGSLRTLAALLTSTEYNVLRSVLAGAVAQEAGATPRGYLFGDMQSMLLLPGDDKGNGGGLDFGNAGFVNNLAALCGLSELLAVVPAKVAGYVATFQQGPQKKYPQLDAPLVQESRRRL